MKITYDKATDALYIYFLSKNQKDKRPELETVPLPEQPNVILDFTKDNKLFGMEILDASKTVDVEYIKKLDFERIDK